MLSYKECYFFYKIMYSTNTYYNKQASFFSYPTNYPTCTVPTVNKTALINNLNGTIIITMRLFLVSHNSF